MKSFLILLAIFCGSIFATQLPKIYNEKYMQVLAYAKHMHEGQARKVTKEPYIVHPIEVANIIQTYGLSKDVDVVLAALLHDVPEDTKDKPPYIKSSIAVPAAFKISTRFKEIYQLFGEKISKLVYSVTQVSKLKDGSKSGDWLDDNLDYAKHLNTAEQQAILLSAADKLSNMRCMIMELANKIISDPNDCENIKSKYWANFGRKKYPDYVVLGKFITLLGLYKLHLKENYPNLVKDLQQAVISLWDLHHSTSTEEVEKILADNSDYQKLYKSNEVVA